MKHLHIVAQVEGISFMAALFQTLKLDLIPQLSTSPVLADIFQSSAEWFSNLYKQGNQRWKTVFEKKKKWLKGNYKKKILNTTGVS